MWLLKILPHLLHCTILPISSCSTCTFLCTFIRFLFYLYSTFIALSPELCTLRFMCLLKILPHLLHCALLPISSYSTCPFFCVPSFDFCFYFYSTFIALSPELYRFNICLTPATKKHILSGLSCKYSNPNGSSPKSRRKNVCRLPNPNRQVRKGLGATNIHSLVPLRLPTTRRLT